MCFSVFKNSVSCDILAKKLTQALYNAQVGFVSIMKLTDGPEETQAKSYVNQTALSEMKHDESNSDFSDFAFS